MLRRTKIVATLGPASESRQELEKMVDCGVDLFRLNFSHGEPEEHIERARLVRDIAARAGRNVAILGDLQGPKIRIARFREGKVTLKAGEDFILDAGLASDAGDSHTVGIAYKKLPQDCAVGDTLLLDDGRLSLKVEAVNGLCVHCTVLDGGTLSNNKGINLQGGGLSAPALTEKDCQDIHTSAAIGVDYLAVSFVRCKEDLEQARRLQQEAGGNAAILAKIERAEVVHVEGKLEEVIEAADAIMVARGDLGVEIGDAELVGVQKKMISMALRLNKPVITATQMMESMVENSLPTRAEVFDVANAVLDGTDAVMLSAETATGRCPHAVVDAMARIAVGAEKQAAVHPVNYDGKAHFESVSETIAMSAIYASSHLEGIKAIACLSKVGQTALLMSRMNFSLPIVTLARSEQTRRRLALYRGVHCLSFDVSTDDPDFEKEVMKRVCEVVKLCAGDKVLMTHGTQVESSCVLKILTVK